MVVSNSHLASAALPRIRGTRLGTVETDKSNCR